jgi:DNA-binding SARP family transcriptional activator
MESGIKFGILGPLLIEVGGKEVPIAAARQRTLLAALLLRANTVVSLETLADTVWEENPPSSYRVTLQGYVMRLRKTLGAEIGSRLHTRNPGYCLTVRDGESELGEFETLVRSARALAAAQDWSRAADVYHTALALWRGDPLADLPALHHEHLHRLQEARMQALEARIEADLHLGRHTELLAELAELTGAQPLRERPAEYLIRALHQAGRRGEALEAYQRTRRALIDELGIDPGPGLRAAHARILDQKPDPDLVVKSVTPIRASGPADPEVDPLAQTMRAVMVRPNAASGGASGASGSSGSSLGSSLGPSLGPSLGSGSQTEPRTDPWTVSQPGAAQSHPQSHSQLSSHLQSPPRPPVPAQLPADLPDFTGREHVLGRIDRRLGNSALAVPVLALTGPGGAGKSTLAIRAAHQASARFPDGQLYAHLAGTTDTPADPADILGRFLRALGVSADAVPMGAPERSAMWRTVLSTRKVLIFVDDATDAEQLIPLIPGAGGSVLLATARDRLTDLYGASFLQIELFNRAESRELFDQIVDPGRTVREKAQVERVLETCADLPLAVRIAASRLASRPRWTVRDLADRLSDATRTLDELTGGAIAVRACFAVSHKQLSADTDRAFRLLACAPGIELGLPAAATLLDLPVRSAEDLLERLVDVHLLESPRAGRYRYHDLIRTFAAEKADELPAEERATAVARLLTWQLNTADAAVAVLLPNRPRTPGIGVTSTGIGTDHGPDADADAVDLESAELDPGKLAELLESVDLDESAEQAAPVAPPAVAPAVSAFADPVTALRWLESEQRSLVGGVALAAQLGRHDLCWRLAAVLEGYFVLRNLWGVWRDTQAIAVESAQATGDPAAQAALLGAHSDASRLLSLTETGLTMTFTSLNQLRNLGDSRASAELLTDLAARALEAGRFGEAADNARQAAAAWRDSAEPDRRAEAVNLAVYGRARLGQGDVASAVTTLRRAVDALLAFDQAGLDQVGLDAVPLDQTDLNALSSASMSTDEPLALALAALAQALDSEQW